MRRILRIGLLCGIAALAGAAQAACPGDCDGTGAVAINELIIGVNIALGASSVAACPSFDTDDNGEVAINELIAAVNAALNGCPATPTPSTPTAEATATTTATAANTATDTPAATVTATPVDTGTAPATATETANASASATGTPPPTDSPTTIATATASPTVASPTSTETPGATATTTVASTPSPTTDDVTPTATFTPTTVPTITPTMSASICGNGFLEPGETCMSCAPDCTVLACTSTAALQTFRVDLQAPPGTSPSALSALIGYRGNRISLPPTGTAARVKMRPPGTSALVNDLDYAVRVVMNAQAGITIPNGKLFTIDFNTCEGAVAVTPSDFGCTIESCGSSFGPIDGCTCTVVTP